MKYFIISEHIGVKWSFDVYNIHGLEGGVNAGTGVDGALLPLGNVYAT